MARALLLFILSYDLVSLNHRPVSPVEGVPLSLHIRSCEVAQERREFEGEALRPRDAMLKSLGNLTTPTQTFKVT